ncbi:HAMP domain-containing histidine kinase [Patescibacteria group bacterium]|nr:HAMP domain-containing histidine kinase [Patescibacteria group bacterium]MCL5091548.1 HAMP domain-containing histidine kinase [Patescibacteria group bacterium]
MNQPEEDEKRRSQLRLLSSATKIFIEGVFMIVIVVLPRFTNIQIKDLPQVTGCIITAFFSSLIFEYWIYYRRKHGLSFTAILNVQLVSSVLLLTYFLHHIDRINGHFFILYGLTMMESSLNLNIKISILVVATMMSATASEWVYLVLKNEQPADLMNFVLLLVRLMYLVFMMVYSRALAKTILAERESRDQIQNLNIELQKANLHLRELDRLKDEFISVTSHELRTPLTAIRSYLWLAIQGKGGPVEGKLKYYIERSYSSTTRMIKLVNDILNISRIETGRINFSIEKINLVKLIKDVIEEVKPRAEELKVKFQLNSSLEDGSGVIGDTDKIKEVLINLIGNALKFTPANGLIKINVREDDMVIVTDVIDTGVGVDKEDIGKLFQKFGMLKGSYVTNQKADQGTGLGLYICKSIIEKLQGKIWVFSAGHNQGSTFSFSLKKYKYDDLMEMKYSLENPEGLGIVHSQV